MNYLSWFNKTVYMSNKERSDCFNQLTETEQNELMESTFEFEFELERTD